jgi:hypothetical protein
MLEELLFLARIVGHAILQKHGKLMLDAGKTAAEIASKPDRTRHAV